jgi:predicted nucleic acid-binding protein
MILADTNILVDILRKNPQTLNFIQALGPVPIVTSEITVMELVFGITGNKFYVDKPKLKQKRLSEIRDLLAKFTILPFDHKAAYKTAEIMGQLKLEGKIIEFRDGMIGGIAVANGLKKMLTYNTRHFHRIPEIELLKIE